MCKWTNEDVIKPYKELSEAFLSEVLNSTQCLTCRGQYSFSLEEAETISYGRA